MNLQKNRWVHSILHWLDYRTGVRDLVKDQLTEYRVPPRLNKWYSLGGLSFFLMVIQLLTGVLLLVYYIPSTEEAFASVQRIMLDIPYGWLMRTSHAAGAHFMG